MSAASLEANPCLDASKQLIFPGLVDTPRGQRKTSTLIDTGASACFISRRWVKQRGFKVMKANRPIRLSLADGVEVGQLTECVETNVTHGSHSSSVLMFVTDLGKFDVILGMNWADYHHIRIMLGPTGRSIEFESDHCRLNCLKHGRPETIYDDRIPLSESRQTSLVGDLCLVSARSALALAGKYEDSVTWVSPHDWDKLSEPSTKDLDAPNAALATSLYTAHTKEDFEKYMRKMSTTRTDEELRKLLPERIYDKWKDLFNEVKANELPPHRKGIDHPIDLTDNKAPRPKIYGLNRQETEAVKKYIDEMLSKGFIRPSNSPYAAPVLVVKKPSGGLRICVDYRALNNLTKKSRNAPPSIKETLARMNRVQIMTLVDVVAAFNTVRIREGDEEKSAFMTRYGLYEYLVMPFGMCNAPGTFQNFINDTIRDCLDDFATAYLDDVLIYSESKEQHDAHVDKVLGKLKGAGLYLDPTKCSWGVTRVKYLGLILTTEGIEMDPSKVTVVRDWPTLRNVKDVQAFLGFCNFYRRFIRGFSRLAKPLTELTKDGAHKLFPLPPQSAAVGAFKLLKAAFTEAEGRFLAHFNPDLETWLETDASDFVYAAVLSQMHPDGVLRPVAFLSHKMTPAECNYEIYDKELLAIVSAFEDWRFELSGTTEPVKVLTDHQALRWFMTNKRLNRRQARWAEFLSEFNFKITYRPGVQGTKPDALTRRTDDLPQGEEDPRRQHQWQTIIKRDQLDPRLQIAHLTASQDNGARHMIRLATLDVLHHLEDVTGLTQDAYCLAETEDVLESRVQQDLAVVMVRACPITVTDRTDPVIAEPTRSQSPDQTSEEPTEVTSGAPEVPTGAAPPISIADLMVEAKTRLKEDPVAAQVVEALVTGKRKLPPALLKTVRLQLSDCELKDGTLYIRNKVFIPEVHNLRTRVIELMHNSACGGHGGKHESFAKIARWYYWPGMTNDIAQYVKACLLCRRTKPYREGKHGLLQPLPIPDRYWSSISMDYITELPACKDGSVTYRHVLVIVDRLSKKKKFIAVPDLKTETLVKSFVEHVWKEEGYPLDIVSDRGAQFVSHFWRRLCERVGTRPKFSTAYHPETDGQTENANAWLKQYLRAYVNYDQDNWAALLPIAEFVANSSISSSTGMTPFEATKGYLPRSGLEPAEPIDSKLTAPARADRARADRFAERINELRQSLRDSLSWAQQKQKQYADDSRHPAPRFKVGDQVMVDFRNARTKRPSQSLDYKNRGPFTIIEEIDGMAYKVDLPPEMRIHNVFHPWLLHLHDAKGLPGQAPIAETPVAIHDPDAEDEQDYDVESIIECRIKRDLRDPLLRNRKGLLQYKVVWKDYPRGPDNPSWEPYMNLVSSADLVYQWHRDHPSIPIHKKFGNLTGKQDMLFLKLSEIFDQDLSAQKDTQQASTSHPDGASQSQGKVASTEAS